MHGKDIRIAAVFLVVLLTGFFCLSAWAPGTDAEKGKADNSTSVTSTADREDTPGVQEQEQAPAKIAKKHFPWLWVAAGVVVVGVVLFFTVFKKPEYKLNVSLGTGVSGTPVAGTFVYKKGKKVHYLYSLNHGYRDLKVTLDNKEVAASGDFTMDGDHTLSVSAEEQFYDLTVTTGRGVIGTPVAGSYNYKVGTCVSYSYAEAPGYTNLNVQVDGVDAPAQGSLLMDKNHALEARASVKEIDLTGEWTILRVSTMGGGTITVHAIFTKKPHYSATNWTGLVQLTSSGTTYGIGQAHYLVDGNTVVIGFYGYGWFWYEGNLNGNNQMEGTWNQCNGYSAPCESVDKGTWTAVRN